MISIVTYFLCLYIILPSNFWTGFGTYKNLSTKMADSRGFRILIFGGFGFRILAIF